MELTEGARIWRLSSGTHTYSWHLTHARPHPGPWGGAVPSGPMPNPPLHSVHSEGTWAPGAGSGLWVGVCHGCIRREGASEAAPEAVRQAVGGGLPKRLLSVTNAIEAGTWRLCLGGGGVGRGGGGGHGALGG